MPASISIDSTINPDLRPHRNVVRSMLTLVSTAIRQRRIKCDSGEPTCMNCFNKGWKCPGYRNMLDVLFRDESAKVVEKAKAGQKVSRELKREQVSSSLMKKPLDDGKPSSKMVELVIAKQMYRTDLPQSFLEAPWPEATLPFNLDELAVGYFYHYYVIGDASESDSWKGVEGESCLSAALIALGVAGVTNSGPSQSCSPATQARYLEAIRLTNNALRSPIDVKKDAVLLAVNLLGIFENITGFQRTLDAWYNHVQGAASLLKYRGSEQFQTAEGGRLFMRTCINLVTSCIGRRLSIPAHIHRLMAEAEQQIPYPESRIWTFLRLHLRFADLYAEFGPGNILPSMENAEPVIKEALTLDRKMLALLNDFSEDWYFETIYAEGPTVFSGYMQVFPHFTVADQYNSIRWKRIVIQDIMLKILRLHPDPSLLHLTVPDLQYVRSASSIIRQLQLDIFASVPQYLGNSFLEINFFTPLSTTSPDGFPRDRLWTNFAIKDSNPWRSRRRQTPSLPLVRMSCTYTIEWSLYIAGAADSMDGELRAWAVKILQLLGNDMSLQQALLLAKSLKMYEGDQLDEHLSFTAGLIS